MQDINSINDPQRSNIRQFHVPKINFSATKLSDLITTKSTENSYEFLARSDTWHLVTLPPLLKGLSFTDVRKFKDKPFVSEFPNHTQTVEMNVKLTSQASSKVIGRIRQMGQGMAIRSSMEELPSKRPKKILQD